MTVYDYLIIGGGMTAGAAAQAIREVDPRGTIAIISAENQPPYNRPPLTKKLWQGKPESIIWRKLPEQGVELVLNCRVTAIDPQAKTVKDESGREYGYKKLLLATGGSPRKLPFGPDDVLYYRTFADYQTVRSWTGKGARIGVIGGGFIGSEIAAALAAQGEQVVMAFPEEGIGARVYPAGLTEYVTNYYRQHGVEVLTGLEIEDIQRAGEKLVMRAKDGQAVEVDHIIAGIGILPNLELAQSAGLAIAGREEGGGIQVDEYLRTSHPDIYAAGDVASFFNPALGRRMRVEHADNANEMGRAAGLNMAVQGTPYHHLPFFYSDLFDLGYEAAGELDPRLETFADWKEPFREGVVYYLKEGHVRGVLLWNTWDQVDAARALIQDGKKYKKEELKGRIG